MRGSQVKLQNTGPLIYISLNHNASFCCLPRSSKHAGKVDLNELEFPVRWERLKQVELFKGVLCILNNIHCARASFLRICYCLTLPSNYLIKRANDNVISKPVEQIVGLSHEFTKRPSEGRAWNKIVSPEF